MKFIKKFFAKLFEPGITAPGTKTHDMLKVRAVDHRGNPVGCTMQCPHCKTWTSDYTREEWTRYQYVATDPISDKKAILTCGKCLQKSEWFTGAPMPIAYSDVRKVE